MLNRIKIYCREMFSITLNCVIAFIAFFEIYFILLLNYDITKFNIGIQELVGGITLFSFLFLLRIVDDFKDYKTDKILFPERPLPSGRVKKIDLTVLGIFIFSVTTVLNLIFMNNIIFYIFVILYGVFMTICYMSSMKMRKNFMLVMFYHTPYLFFMSIYVISFTYIKYGLESISYIILFLSIAIYIIGFIRGIAKQSGMLKQTWYLAILGVINTIVNIFLISNINFTAIYMLIISLIYFLIKLKQSKLKIFDVAFLYVLVQESIIVISIILYFI